MKSSHFQSKTELVRKVDDTFRPLHLEISSFKEHAKICNDLRYSSLFIVLSAVTCHKVL